MSFLVDILVGAGIGILTVWLPSMQLFGYVGSGYFGPFAILVCFSVHVTFGTIRDLLSPDTSGNFDLLSIWEFSDQVTAADAYRLAHTRVGALLSGLVLGGIIVSVGLSRIPRELTWFLVFVICLCQLGDRMMSWLYLIAIGLFVKLVSGLGFSSTALGVVSVFGLVQSHIQIQHGNTKFDSRAINIFNATLFGIFSGVIPGLNVQSLHSTLDNSEQRYQECLIGGAVAEGITLAVFLWSHATSRSTLTAYLTQFTRGEDFNGMLLAGILCLSLGVCFFLNPIWLWLAQSICRESQISYQLSQLVPIASALYFFGYSGLIWAALTYLGARFLFVPALQKGWISQEIRPLVVSVPLLLG